MRRKMGCWQFLKGFVNFYNICHAILKKNPFFSGLIFSVNRRRKDIKVTFASLRLLVLPYFHILILSYTFRRNLLWIQGLQSICSVT